MSPKFTYMQDGYMVQAKSISSWVIGAKYGHVDYDKREFHSEHVRSMFKKFQQIIKTIIIKELYEKDSF